MEIFTHPKVDHISKYFCFLDQFNWLPNEIFFKSDKLGMRNNLEVEVLFSDLDITKIFL